MNQETPVEASSANPPLSVPPRSPSGAGVRALAVLAVLASLAAGAATYYLWQIQTGERHALRLAQGEVEELQARLRERGGALDQALTALAAKQKAQQEILDLLNARNRQGQQGASRDWVLREAEYLLLVANQRLQLDRDVASAIAALKAANERLRDLSDPALLIVRRKLAEELGALRAVPAVDHEGMVLTLISAAQRIDELPLANVPKPAPATAAPAAENPARDWSAALDAAWEALKRLVVIRRDNLPVQPLLAPEQEYFLRQNLRLQLEAARVALLRDDADSFGAGLKSARDWLKQYFDARDAAVSSTIDTLDDLLKKDIRPALPDISESLRLLRQQLAPERTMEGKNGVRPQFPSLLADCVSDSAWKLGSDPIFSPS